MRHQGLNYAAVGVFVIAMLMAAVASAALLSGGTVSSERYFAVFDNVADVKFGTQVRYEGFPVGQVESIEPVIENGVTVFHLELSVREGFAIPEDSVARVHASQFLGAKTVEITRGASPEVLAPGTRIASAPANDMFAAMSSVAGQVGQLSEEGLKPLLARLTQLVTNADRLLGDDVTTMIGSLNAVAEDTRGRVPQITGELLAFMQEMNATLASVQALLSERNVAGMEQTLANVNTVSQDFVAITASLQQTLQKMDGIVTDLQQVVESNQGNVNAALEDTRYILRSVAQNIDSINHNLAGTSRNMNEFSLLIRQNPGPLHGGSAPEEVSADTPVTRSRAERDFQ